MFNEICFLNNLFGFTPFWDHKPANAIHADSPSVYTSEIFVESSTKNKIQLKCYVFDDSVVNESKQSIL